eukprot:2296537-Rhodomonas_salina.1
MVTAPGDSGPGDWRKLGEAVWRSCGRIDGEPIGITAPRIAPSAPRIPQCHTHYSRGQVAGGTGGRRGADRGPAGR